MQQAQNLNQLALIEGEAAREKDDAENDDTQVHVLRSRSVGGVCNHAQDASHPKQQGEGACLMSKEDNVPGNATNTTRNVVKMYCG